MGYADPSMAGYNGNALTVYGAGGGMGMPGPGMGGGMMPPQPQYGGGYGQPQYGPPGTGY